MKKLYRNLLVVACLLSSTTMMGQSVGAAAFAAEADARTYLGNYFEPLIISASNGLANGWNNTAKPHKLFGFDVTTTISVAGIPDADYTFTFRNEDYNSLRLATGTEAEVPTFAGGGPNGVRLEAYEQNTGVTTDTFDPPSGLDLGSIPVVRAGVPVPTVNIGFGLPKDTELRVRFIPVSSVGSVSVDGSFGVGVKHNIKQWIPGMKLVPLSISAFVGYNQFNFQYLDGDNEVNFSSKATTFELLVSKKLLFFTPYIGLGANMINSDFDFTLTEPNGTRTVEGDFAYDNIGGARFTVGGRLKILWVLTLHADYTFQRYNNFSVGLGINVR